MDLVREIARRLRRWDLVLIAAVAALPFAALMVLGALWLVEHGALLPFIAVSLGANLLLWFVRRLARRLRRRAPAAAEPPPQLAVAPDPDWSAADLAAFRAAQALIRQRTAAAVEWEALQPLALEVMETVARSFPGGKTTLDFTIPEALLLVERVSGRFRGDLLRQVPFSDRIAIRHVRWVWSNRERIRQAGSALQLVRHGARFVTNMPAAIVGIAEQVFATRAQSYLSAEGIAILQGVLLEELAKSAVDLYSGRLRFSDAELLDIQLAESGLDRRRLARPDQPLRVVVVGQISAGKSRLISALAGADLTETDAAPTTDRATAHEVEVGGLPCFLVDTPGIDGSAGTRAQLLAELTAADLVLWALRADRPGRAPDAGLLAALRAAFDATPERRRPPVVAVLTHIDLLTAGWPHAEHALSPAARDGIAGMVRAIAAELGLPEPIPVALSAPEWNVEAVVAAVEARAADALAVQRNRSRLTGRGSTLAQARRETQRAGAGLLSATRTLGRQLLRRNRGESGEG